MSKREEVKGITSTFHFFGGKGGVGKTTCAAAFAVAAARGRQRVLVASVDPAHSLGDALRLRLSSRPMPVPLGRLPRGLVAVELDPKRSLARWLERHGRALGDVLEHGTWLDRDDVNELLGLTIPGVDELLGVLEVVRLASGSRPKPRTARETARGYDAVIVDTTPTGHALRLFGAPQAAAAIAGVLDELQREHRRVREQLARVRRPEAADRLIELLKDQAQQAGEILRDPARAVVHWVTLPEELSRAETADALGALAASGIAVPEIIVNCVTPDAPPCSVCDRRRRAERDVLADLRRLAGDRRLMTVFAELDEPRGMRALERIGKRLLPRPGLQVRAAGRNRAGLQARSGSRTADLQTRPGGGRAGLRAGPSAISGTVQPRPPGTHPIDCLQSAQLVFFGGKGGVGKTTVAAAAALRLSRLAPGRSVLLLSTDPAHSLGDVFGTALSDVPATLPGGPRNLFVRELDAAAALAARRRELDRALEELAGAGGSAAGAGRGIRELVALAPPGIDELFGMLSILEARAAHDMIIVDTAPTGHALRLLEMPDAAREWLRVLLRVLLKYRRLARPGRLAADVLELSKHVRALQDLLRSAPLTRFVVVARPAELPLLETERLFARLRRLRVAARMVVVNAATLEPRRCVRCRRTREAERRIRRRIAAACRRSARDCVIIHAPLAQPPPRGIRSLERWSQAWIA
jgi:arsenite-transporting ATPase